jgi:hypothetical protein
VGVDGISVLFVMLTTFLMPITIAACWGVTHRVKEYMIAMLVLETLMIGVFVALDLVLFYLFFEAGLIPMFLIIGIWGGKDRIYASLQVLPLHLPRLGPDAGRDGGDVCGCGHHGYRRLLAHQFSPGHDRPSGPDRGRDADAAVARLLREFRGEDADVAGAHLAARRPRAGADGGLRRAGGDPAEDGRLRLPALQPADVPRRLRHLRAAVSCGSASSRSSTPRWWRWCRRT